MNPRLYVGNLSPGVTEADLRVLFSRIGAITDVQLMLDPTTHQSRGYAFITMATPSWRPLLCGNYIPITLPDVISQ
jgi:RNA recognition motif-containing protein